MSVLVSQLRGRDPTRWAPRKVTREEFHFVRIRPHFFDLFKCPVCSDLLASDFGLLHVFQHQYAINLERAGGYAINLEFVEWDLSLLR